MKIIPVILTFLTLVNTVVFARTAKDTITRKQYIHSQTIKSDTLNQWALKLAAPGASRQDLDEAIRLIMKGLHNYSRFRDSTGLRQTFDNLAYVYLLQKKMVQAKWFYIQSNSMAREMRDTTNIIRSLVALSGVKALIKDYSMAIRDLHEAAQLARARKGFAIKMDVQTALADYYSRKGDFKRAALANDTIALLKDSVPRIDTPTKTPETKQVIVKQQPKPVPIVDNGSIFTTVIIVVVFVLLLLFVFISNKRKR